MTYLPRLLVLGCFVILCGAYVFEKISSHPPCILCHYARWIYLAIGGSLLINLKVSKGFYKARIFFAFLAFLASLSGIALSCFHSLLERKLIQVKLRCTSALLNNLDSLEALIEQTPVSRCDEISWSLFGITLANLNILLFSLMAMGCWKWLRREGLWKKNRTSVL